MSRQQDQDQLHVVVLAAGKGERFAEHDPGVPKLLRPLRATTLIRSTIFELRISAGFEGPVHVVVASGDRGKQIEEHVASIVQSVVVAPRATEGIHYSAYDGIRHAVRCGARRVALLLGDDPIAARDLPRLVERFAQPLASNVDRVAVLRPTTGPHPIVFLHPNAIRRSDLGHAAMDSARTCWIDGPDTLDVDTPADLTALRRRLAGK